MPKLSFQMSRSRNWHKLGIFTHNNFGHKLEKLTIIVNQFLYFSYVKLFPGKI